MYVFQWKTGRPSVVWNLRRHMYPAYEIKTQMLYGSKCISFLLPRVVVL